MRWESQARTGGKRVVNEFTAVLARLTDDDLRKLAADIAADSLDDRAIARRLLRGWGTDVTAADGGELEYSEANVAALLNIAGVASASVRQTGVTASISAGVGIR